MNILMFGDIIGRPGRRAIKKVLPELKKDYDIDFVVANGENAAGGCGITRKVSDELFSEGIDVLTTGNHVWDQKEVLDFIKSEDRILRPANYPPGTPGKGYNIYKSKSGIMIKILNVSGRIFLSKLDCPFRTADEFLCWNDKAIISIVDFHAEATSEKVAFSWYLAGKVSAVCGTHTHIPTADARILPGGTAYITDIGMTGPRDSVLGVNKEIVIRKFLTQMPVRLEPASGDVEVNAVLIKVANENGKAQEIVPIQKILRG